MKKIIESLKTIFNHWPIRILTLVVLLFTAVFVWSTATRNPDANRFGPVSYPLNILGANETMPPTKISFSFAKNLKLPATANVYAIENPGEDSVVSFFDKVSSALGLSERTEIKTYQETRSYIKTQNGLTFAGDLSTGGFIFTGKSAVSFEDLSEKGLKEEAIAFLSDLGLNINVNNDPRFSYFDYLGSELSLSQDSLDSDAIMLSYQPTIDSLPVVGLGAKEYPISLLVDRETGLLVRLDYLNPDIDQNTKGVYKLLGLKEIKETAPGQLKIFSLLDENGERIANVGLSDLPSVVFDKIDLAYFITDKSQSLLTPVFVLEGRTSVKNQEKGAIIKGYVPAIKEAVLTP